jgi:[acyl-carrier-protein] S-malonyltransferase
MALVGVFPGQGSQYIGMGKDFYNNFAIAKDVYHEVDDVLNYKLSELIFNATEEELKQTDKTQPALMATSIAIVRVLEAECGLTTKHFKYLAGHSLGEYSALCFAGAISLKDTALALQARGRAMMDASLNYKGSMLAIVGFTDEALDNLIKDALVKNPDSILVKANDNANGQMVLSGSVAAAEYAAQNAKAFGIKMAVAIPVSGAFHSPHMQAATSKVQEFLDSITINTPAVPVIQNYNALPVSEPLQIKQNLIKQIEGSVKWRQTMMFCEQNGITNLVEIGAKNVLCGLCKRTAPSIVPTSIEKVENINLLQSIIEQIKNEA